MIELKGSARQLKSIPEELQIRQTGKDKGHYEIIPRQPNALTREQFLELLNRVEYH
jgi:hypothetical protein